MPYFICPNCGDRSLDSDRLEGLSGQPVGCHRCGFGFLFELLEDYYPAPTAALIACDRDGRILSAGRGVFELTGYGEKDVMGRDLREVFQLGGYAEGKDPIGTVLEWGVRQLGQPLTLRHRNGFEKRVRGDFFPAYDNDGGMLASIAPEAR
jgi:PAS domain S-box-containing protein